MDVTTFAILGIATLTIGGQRLLLSWDTSFDSNHTGAARDRAYAVRAGLLQYLV